MRKQEIIDKLIEIGMTGLMLFVGFYLVMQIMFA